MAKTAPQLPHKPIEIFKDEFIKKHPNEIIRMLFLIKLI
ncbi:hypothetical protein B807_1065 [Fructilactobacillus florum 2F]|nr:hypothetical protein B807_1065 [Fructilactobacillus florum 2F]